jgi:hypothetical protein
MRAHKKQRALPLTHNTVGNYRIVMMTRGPCTALCDDEIKQGNIRNGKVRVSKGGQIMGFEFNGITIDEHEHYQNIQMTLDTLNGSISQEKHKYIYIGQTPHSLAHVYYTNNYDRTIFSICSPQAYDILTSNACVNSPFFACLSN